MKERIVLTYGTFDLFHIGHLNLIKFALEKAKEISPNVRLVVSVVSDKDAQNYKRLPILSYSQRVDFLDALLTMLQVKYTIVECPFPKLTTEFIEKNDISVVVASEEYDPEKNPDNQFSNFYSEVIANPKITMRFKPRTAGISTSGLIRELKKRATASKS